MASALSASCLFLAACSSSSGSASGPIDPVDPPTDPVDPPEPDSELVGDILAAGGTFSANDSTQVALLLDSATKPCGPGGTGDPCGTGETSFKSGTTTVAIERNASGSITLIVDGARHEFAAAPGTSRGFFGQQFGSNFRPADMFLVTGDLDSFVNDGARYAEVFTYSTRLPNDSPQETIRGYVVIGTETADEVLSTLANVTYNGEARLELFPAEGFEFVNTSRSSLKGDLTLTVNLDSTGISGGVDNLFFTPAGGDEGAVLGSIDMEEASFGGSNSFSAALTPDSNLIGSVDQITETGTGEYSGAFFGPNGEEVGGTLSYSSENATGGGYFYSN